MIKIEVVTPNPGVHLTSGMFDIDGTLTVPANVSLVGAGAGATVIRTAPDTTAIRVIGDRAKIEALMITFPRSSGHGGIGIRLGDFDQGFGPGFVVFRDLYINSGSIGYGTRGIGIKIRVALENNFNNIQIEGFNTAISNEKINDNSYSNANTCNSCYIRNNYRGIYTEGSFYLYGCTIEGNVIGIVAGQATGSREHTMAVKSFGSHWENYSNGSGIGTNAKLVSGKHWFFGDGFGGALPNQDIVSEARVVCVGCGFHSGVTLQPNGSIFSIGGTPYPVSRTGVGYFGEINMHGSMSAYNSTAFQIAPLVTKRIEPTFGSTVSFNSDEGNEFVITATNGNAFTVQNPTSNYVPFTGQRITIRIKNVSGRELGTARWGEKFKMAGWQNPANGFSRAIDFQWDGDGDGLRGHWIEVSRTPLDVPN